MYILYHTYVKCMAAIRIVINYVCSVCIMCVGIRYQPTAGVCVYICVRAAEVVTVSETFDDVFTS